MKHSNIFLSFDDYMMKKTNSNLSKKLMRKKYKKDKKNNPNQKSFYFEDYLEINHKKSWRKK